MSPFITLNSWGSSSNLNLRMNLPTLVRLLLLSFITGLCLSNGTSALFIERNL